MNSSVGRWEWVHVCIDNRSQLAYVEVLKDEKAETVAAFLERPAEHLQKLGVPVHEVMTDNEACYRSKVFRKICEWFDLRHLFTRPYRHQTNGKAERFIQTLIYEWAYGNEYQTSDERKGYLPRRLSYYNQAREHGGLDDRPPFTRLMAWVCEQLSCSTT